MSNLARFPWESLPRVTPAQARSTQLAARLGGSRALRAVARSIVRAFELSELPAPGLGRHVVGIRSTDRRLSSDAATAFLLGRVGGLSHAIVLVDENLAVAIVGDLLETRVSHIDDWMFGSLAYILARTIEGAREDVPALRDSRVDLSREPREVIIDRLTGPGPVIELGMELAYAGEHGWVRLLCRAADLETMPASVIAAEQLEGFASFRSTYRVGIGRVRLRHAEVRTLAPGDAILFDEHAIPGEQGGRKAPARLMLSSGFVRGVATIEDRRWCFEISGERPLLKEDVKMTETDETTQLLRASAVNVEAVVGRVELTLDELARLAPGQVLQTEQTVGEPVELFANGRLVGRGELVDVQGRLGVRLLAVGQ